MLFTTLAFAHLLHHYFLNAGEAAHSPPFLADVGIGVGYIFLHRRMFADKTWAVIREFWPESASWEAIGWRVWVNFVSLLNKIRRKDHIDGLRRVLPSSYSPLQESGKGIQAVYLTEVPISPAELYIVLIGKEAAMNDRGCQIDAPDPHAAGRKCRSGSVKASH